MEDGHVFVMEESGAIIAGAILFIDNHSLYVGRIFVSPDSFRKGIGMQLMDEVENYYIDVTKVALDTPLWNSRTNSFYKKCNYKEVRRDAEFVYYEKVIEGLGI